jgi:hypothetical protein
VKRGEPRPDGFRLEGNAEVSGLDAVAGVEVKVGFLARGPEGLQTPFIERSVQIVCMQKAYGTVVHRAKRISLVGTRPTFRRYEVT